MSHVVLSLVETPGWAASRLLKLVSLKKNVNRWKGLQGRFRHTLQGILQDRRGEAALPAGAPWTLQWPDARGGEGAGGPKAAGCPIGLAAGAAADAGPRVVGRGQVPPLPPTGGPVV